MSKAVHIMAQINKLLNMANINTLTVVFAHKIFVS